MYASSLKRVTWLSALILLTLDATLAQTADLSNRAQQLGLTKTWSYTFPNSTLTSGKDGASYVTSNWKKASNQFYGSEDVSFVADPITSTSSTSALRVLYAAGSYAPTGSKSSMGSVGGTEFFSSPFGNQSYDSVLLRYDLAFDSSFQWVQGGKLPGIFGGPPGSGCSGGNAASGSNCFSVRLMWRQNGAGEAYAYIPHSDDLCKQSSVMCNDQYGTSFSRGILNFQQNKWTTMEIYVKVNNASSSNGILKVWQDGNVVVNQDQLKYRTSNAVAASSLFFSTFFGGGDPSYATLDDTYTYYKNIQFSVGQQVELNDSGAMTLFGTGPWWSYLSASLLLYHLLV
ncbi:hypothetical protein [Absidia glauca]|uniref:Polysaccharide lyase 14 domain-containing protein n=1 Tax=Absidia glauca TaxID=4829 RepID=A0A163K1X8_ABSGL|nr:hypothetical protein [Absidia glauca]